MSWIGDFRLGDTFDTKFTTVNTSGAPTTLAGTPVISAYVGNSTTELTAGITLTVDFDSRTGMHNIRVVATSGNGYATTSNYQLVITTGTVSGTSVVGYVVGEFSIENRSAVMPTVAARTLDVASTGEAGVDFSNVNGTLDAAEIGTGAITAAKFAAGAIDAAAIADNAIDRATFAADTGLQSIRSNTAQAGASTSITLDASASATTDFYKYCLIYLTGATGAGQYRLCTAYNGTTKVATVTPAWATNPDATSTFAVQPHGIIDVESWLGTAVVTPDTAGYPKVTVKPGTNTGEINLSGGLVTVGTNNDKTGYALVSSEHTNVADALLKRDMSVVTGESARSPLNAMRFLRNKWTSSGGTLTVYKEDDTTSAWTSALVDTPGANPITSSDPA